MSRRKSRKTGRGHEAASAPDPPVLPGDEGRRSVGRLKQILQTRLKAAIERELRPFLREMLGEDILLDPVEDGVEQEDAVLDGIENEFSVPEEAGAEDSSGTLCVVHPEFVFAFAEAEQFETESHVFAAEDRISSSSFPAGLHVGPPARFSVFRAGDDGEVAPPAALSYYLARAARRLAAEDVVPSLIGVVGSSLSGSIRRSPRGRRFLARLQALDHSELRARAAEEQATEIVNDGSLSTDQKKRKIKQLFLAWHPDKWQGPEYEDRDREIATDIFQRLSKIYGELLRADVL